MLSALKTSIQRNSQRIILNNTTRTFSTSIVNRQDNSQAAPKNTKGIEMETLHLLQNSVTSDKIKPKDVGQRYQKMHHAGDIYHPKFKRYSLSRTITPTPWSS
ncbi:unnamed protein product [Cunninghamella echinulata]